MRSLVILILCTLSTSLFAKSGATSEYERRQEMQRERIREDLRRGGERADARRTSEIAALLSEKLGREVSVTRNGRDYWVNGGELVCSQRTIIGEPPPLRCLDRNGNYSVQISRKEMDQLN